MNAGKSVREPYEQLAVVLAQLADEGLIELPDSQAEIDHLAEIALQLERIEHLVRCSSDFEVPTQSEASQCIRDVKAMLSDQEPRESNDRLPS